MNICLATCAEIPNGIEDDRALFAELTRRGHNVRWQIWNDPIVDWRFFEKVVIRSTWDYHYHLDDYIRWIAAVSLQSTLINPKEVFMWNFDKRYLQKLSEKGVAVVESTIFSDEAQAITFAQSLFQRDKKLIIKPTVSASAHLNFLIKTAADIDKAVQKVLDRSEVMIQPFVESVLTDGEVSLLFFGGKYSHALRKFALGDYRIQAQYGGQVAAFEPSMELIHFAEKALAAVPFTLAYARVDILDWKHSAKIGELELIEPELFFRMAPNQVQSFSDSISK